ncbi:hypothetical protein D3C72_1262370 [compost metagenome]
MKHLVLALALLTLAACASDSKSSKYTSPVDAPSMNTPDLTVDASTSEPQIDYVALQRSLNLDIAVENLGVREKGFNTCDVGYGYSKNKNCRRQYFFVLNFRLMCRDSEGTISTTLTDADTMAIAGRPVTWTLTKGLSGVVQTDGLGYAQIATVAPIPQSKQRVKIAVGNEFLYMRANEMKKVITPKPWCN